ncbi:putative immunoglobulin-blocking virulence protein [Mycoplasma sp. Z386]
MRNFLKQSKVKKTIAILTTSITIPVTGAGIYFAATTDSANSTERSKLLKDNIISINTGTNLDFKDGLFSHRDNNQKVKQIKKPEKKPEITISENPKEPEEPLKPPASEKPEEKILVSPPKQTPPPPPEKEPKPEPEPITPDDPEPENPKIIDINVDNKVTPETPKEEPQKPPAIVPEEPKQPEQPVEPPKPEPVQPVVIEEPVVQPKPVEKPVETPQPEPVQPKPQDKNIEILHFENTDIVAHVTRPRERILHSDDVAKKITNRVPYVANITPKINSIEVTDEIRAANTKSAIKALTRTFNQEERDSLRTPNSDMFSISRYIELNEDYYKVLFDKFSRLIENGDKVREFLTDEGKQKYPELKALKDKNERYARIISYIDPNKFTKTSQAVETMLGKGYVIEPENRNVYIDANGEINSYSFEPLINGVVATRKRDNSEKRVFGYSSQWSRSPEDVQKGVYPGWTKRDVTSDYRFTSYNVSRSDGFTISELTRDEPIQGKRNKGLVVEIDASNNKGYAKTLGFIRQAKENGLEITSYKIKNIGTKDANQRFYDIFKALPDNLPQLELYFETNNTSALIALENKKIDELSLYTTKNVHSDSWSINPLALRNVAFVNTLDYNVSREYGYGVKVFSRIVFDTLSFEESDLGSNPTVYKDLTRINDGLRMAYFVRNNEGIFQGSFGPGLDADHNEGGNSYPLGLDFSRAPSIKSLRGMRFYDIHNSSNGVRKLKRIKFFNNSDTFEIDADELNNAQWADILDQTLPQMPRSKIGFSNGSQTSKIKIVSKNGVNSLTPEGVRNLNTLLDWSDGNFNSNTTIYVGEHDTMLYKQMQNIGKRVAYSSSENFEFN